MQSVEFPSTVFLESSTSVMPATDHGQGTTDTVRILVSGILDITCSMCLFNCVDAGWSSPVARWAHNPKVVGSNPTPATNDLTGLRRCRNPFFLDVFKLYPSEGALY